jgi:hypothetical protein
MLPLDDLGEFGATRVAGDGPPPLPQTAERRRVALLLAPFTERVA